jgi:hypothetical protein
LVGNGAAWSEATLQAIKAPANARPKATLKVCMFSSVIWCQMPRNEAALGRTTHSPAAGFHTGSDLWPDSGTRSPLGGGSPPGWDAKLAATSAESSSERLTDRVHGAPRPLSDAAGRDPIFIEKVNWSFLIGSGLLAAVSSRAQDTR